MDNPFLGADNYHTDENASRSIFDILSFNTRTYFMIGFFSVVLKARRAVLKGSYEASDWAQSSYDILKLIENCGGRFHITGLNNLYECKEPVVFVSNHMSTLETMVFPCIIAPVMKVTFVVKESLVMHPFLGPTLRSQNPIVVGRKNPRADFQTIMRKGKELLSNGISLIIFPQSTRNVDFKPSEFNSIGVKLARNANVKVIPVAIKTDFWGNGKRIKDLGPIDRTKPINIAFGEPLTIENTGKEENEFIIDYIKKHLEVWMDTEVLL